MSFAHDTPTATVFGLSTNPFLSTGDGSSSVRKCIMPSCQENTVKDFLACAFHSGPVSPKPLKVVVDNQHRTDAVHTTGRVLEAPTAQSRKQLDAKVTARKSAARSFVLPPSKTNGTKTNGASLSPVSRITTNGSHASSIPTLLGQVGRSPPETPLRKRQRISSPKTEVTSPKFARPILPSREISAPYANHSILNGRDRDSWPNSYASFLGREDEQASTRSSSQDTHRLSSVNSTVFGLKAVLSPIRAESVSNGRRPGSAGLVSELRELNNTNRNHTSSRITSLEKTFEKTLEKTQWRGPTPANPKKREKVTKSPYSGLKFITRTPPLEKQRRHLAETVDTSALDKLIYGQEASSEPPPGVEEPLEEAPRKRQDVSYVDIDPRTHWTRPHSDEWYRKKEEEIKARGGRKANFGKAAQRMREQRLNENPDAWEEHLPDRVKNNEAWLGAMRWFHSREQGRQASASSQANGHVPLVRKKRPYRRRNQVAVPEPETEPSDAPGRLNSELSNSDTEARLARKTKPLLKAQNEAWKGYYERESRKSFY
ncbi:hypothetical protein VP1G_06862 [Cytospora mali]|uniref:Uncharacterized protein n=1 Tax=Cytospora mali TaxID=578113 RepID=A0A194V6M1_CYTMA|nr:hypothetical protein VP1G_06862 [Valsa mali var. pyri (nom. inval.)]